MSIGFYTHRFLTLLVIVSVLFSPVDAAVQAKSRLENDLLLNRNNMNPAQAEANSASQPTPPAPGALSPAMEKLRAQEAIKIALTKYLEHAKQPYQDNPDEVVIEGDWGYRTISTQSEGQPTNKSLTILAHRLPSGEWQALLPQDNEGYLQWLNSVPETLVARNAKEQIRAQAAQATEPSRVEQVNAQPTATPTPSRRCA